MKTCNKCKQEKPKSEFYNIKASEDKLSNLCKSCYKAKEDETEYAKTYFVHDKYLFSV